ncbi:pilus assembly FimT family protein [Stagnimonas aquatica]|nr:GspH/FimT family pseudopilin [Stagnimonas aquatica]
MCFQNWVDDAPPPGRQRGFTVIELLVTIAVMAILVAMAVPSYRSAIASNRLSVASYDYFLAVSEARVEAVRRNTSTQVCAASGNGSGALATACGTTNTGAVYALDSSGAAFLLRAAPEIPSDIEVANVAALRYSAQGLARAPGSTTPYRGRLVDLKSSALSANGHRCIYMTAGILLKTCSNTAACDANTEPSDCQ